MVIIALDANITLHAVNAPTIDIVPAPSAFAILYRCLPCSVNPFAYVLFWLLDSWILESYRQVGKGVSEANYFSGYLEN